jgi:predicted Kef-type K+ transport protein
MELAWVGAAYGLGLLASRFGLPPLVGYLGAGFALWGLGYQNSALLKEIASVGVLLLLFTVGLKLRFASLIRREVLGVGGIHLVLFALLLGLVTLLLGLSSNAALFMGVGLAFSSTVLAVKLLDDRRELSTFHGRVAVGILVLQDLGPAAAGPALAASGGGMDSGKKRPRRAFAAIRPGFGFRRGQPG